ncbi:metalloprotease [Halosimplex pelagicum]|uniref:metalloprotease n=1 Tax=Halosimplex pelagicum TaxID=869886 RepID=UPI003CCD9E4C
MSGPAGGRAGRSGGRGGSGRSGGGRGWHGISFSRRELRDLGIAWLALGVAFTLFIDRALVDLVARGARPPAALALALAVSLATVGVAFLLHELAHKVVAVRFGQVAAFKADYGMLFLAVMSALAGFLFAAPGAVVHRGRITARENGLISLAGPVTNVGLAAVFLPLFLFGPGLLGLIGGRGLSINLLLAGFNMIPYGPLDGRKVLRWSKPVYVAVAVPTVLLAVYALVGLGL